MDTNHATYRARVAVRAQTLLAIIAMTDPSEDRYSTIEIIRHPQRDGVLMFAETRETMTLVYDHHGYADGAERRWVPPAAELRKLLKSKPVRQAGVGLEDLFIVLADHEVGGQVGALWSTFGLTAERMLGEEANAEVKFIPAPQWFDGLVSRVPRSGSMRTWDQVLKDVGDASACAAPTWLSPASLERVQACAAELRDEFGDHSLMAVLTTARRDLVRVRFREYPEIAIFISTVQSHDWEVPTALPSWLADLL